MLSFSITIFITVIFSILVGYCYLEEDRENIFDCDALAQRSVFCLKKYILGMERVVKKTVEGSERRKIKVEEKNSFQDSDETKTSFTS